MNYCLIKENPKCQTLKNMSGLSEFETYSFIESFYNNNKRFPELDEIPYADSELYLKDKLNIHTSKAGTNYTTFDKIANITHTLSIEESNIILNQEYPDLEIHLIPIESSTIVEIEHRPSEYAENEKLQIDFDVKDSSKVIIDSLNRLQLYYGVLTIPITKYEIANNPELDTLSVSEAHGFIYNNNIYINTDVADVNTPIHEQLHLFLGSIRYLNPELYFSLVSSVQNLPSFLERVQGYPNRSISDASEEIFVEELSKYVIKEPSMFDELDAVSVNLLMYNIQRDIDSILMGKQSVKNISGPFGNSLLELAEYLGSDNFNMDSVGTLDRAAIHRIMANTKEELIANNELILTCQ